MIQTNIYEEFESWLDNVIEGMEVPEETVAFCFNLYEESAEENIYSIQLIAASSFDENDGDWPCDEVWSSGEDIFTIDISDEDDKSWQQAQKLFTEMVREYLDTGRYHTVLLSRKAVGIGFVDGEIDIIFHHK